MSRTSLEAHRRSREDFSIHVFGDIERAYFEKSALGRLGPRCIPGTTAATTIGGSPPGSLSRYRRTQGRNLPSGFSYDIYQ
jgi:hypothetical protein